MGKSPPEGLGWSQRGAERPLRQSLRLSLTVRERLRARPVSKSRVGCPLSRLAGLSKRRGRVFESFSPCVVPARGAEPQKVQPSPP